MDALYADGAWPEKARLLSTLTALMAVVMGTADHDASWTALRAFIYHALFEISWEAAPDFYQPIYQQADQWLQQYGAAEGDKPS